MSRPRHIVRSAAFYALALLLTTNGGCRQQLHFGEVDGVLLIKGRPAHKVLIQFIPDIDKGTTGPMSIAETDDNGRFTLLLSEADDAHPRPGALVGWHRIVLSDLQLAASATGRGVPIRLKPEYTLPASSPLTHQVHEGKQTINLEIP